MKKLLIIAFLLLTLGFASALQQIDILFPDGNYEYMKTGMQIKWAYKDNNNQKTDYNFNLFYSIDQNKFGNKIADINGPAYCTDTDRDISTLQQCSYTWTSTGATDGNYYIDINAFSYRNAGAGLVYVYGPGDANTMVSGSSTFSLDNTNPAVVTDLTGTASDGQVKLYWLSVANAKNDWNYYTIWYNNAIYTDCTTATADGNRQTTAGSGSENYTVDGLTNSTNYWFCITRTDLAGNVNNSATVISAMPTATVYGGAPSGGGGATTQEGVGATAGAVEGGALQNQVQIGNSSIPVWLLVIIGAGAYFFLLRKKRRK